MSETLPQNGWPPNYPPELRQHYERPNRHPDPMQDLLMQIEIMRRDMEWMQREHNGQFQRLYQEISSLRNANAQALAAITDERDARVAMEKKYLAGIAGLLAIAVFRTVWEATLK